MEKNIIQNCSAYFNYGNISSSIRAISFSCTEEEEGLVDTVVNTLEKRYSEKHIYCFTTKTALYPLSTKDKTFGLWKNLSKDKKLNAICLYRTIDNRANGTVGGF